MPPTRLYATIVSHNEQDTNAGCQPVLDSAAIWHQNRTETLTFARAIVDAGGAYDLQSDFRWIQQMDLWEDDAERAETNNQNLLAYLSTQFPGQVTVDAHNHDASHNYADVAKMLADRGVPDSAVVGGFIWSPTEDADWERFRAPLAGIAYPGTAWNAEILWGGATLGHKGPDSEASGVWRPADAANFHSDDPAGDVVTLGNYIDAKYEVGHGAGIADLLDQIANGEHPEGVMLTVQVFFDQCGLTQQDTIDVNALIEMHKADVDAGTLVWATLPEVVSTWRTEYSERAYIANAP